MANFLDQENKPAFDQKASSLPKPDYRKYQDPTGELDSRGLELGLWYTKNKVLLYRIFLVLLGVIGGALWLFSLINWIVFFVGIPQQTNLEQSLSRFNNYTFIQSKFAPIPLQVEMSSVFVGGVKKMDAVAKIVNPNKDFIVKINYNFTIAGKTTSSTMITILPGQITLAPVLGLDFENVNSDVSFQIEGAIWQRISSHKISNPIAYQEERLNFEPSNFIYTSANSELNVNRLTFNLKNKSAYGYKEPKFYLALVSNDSIIGVMQFQTDNFKSGEEKEIDLRNFTPGLMVQKIEVYPVIDVYNKEVYLAPEAN